VVSSGNDGVYTAVIDHTTMDLMCDMTTDGGGWTVSEHFVSFGSIWSMFSYNAYDKQTQTQTFYFEYG